MNHPRIGFADTGQEFFNRVTAILADLQDVESGGNAAVLYSIGILRVIAASRASIVQDDLGP